MCRLIVFIECYLLETLMGKNLASWGYEPNRHCQSCVRISTCELKPESTFSKLFSQCHPSTSVHLRWTGADTESGGEWTTKTIYQNINFLVLVLSEDVVHIAAVEVISTDIACKMEVIIGLWHCKLNFFAKIKPYI